MKLHFVLKSASVTAKSMRGMRRSQQRKPKQQVLEGASPLLSKHLLYTKCGTHGLEYTCEPALVSCPN